MAAPYSVAAAATLCPGEFITGESFPNTKLRAPLTGASARGAHLQAASPPSVGRPEHPTAPRAASQRGAEKNIVLCKNDRH